MRLWKVVLMCVVAFMLLVPLNSFAKKEIVVGGKNFTEQYILAEMAKLLLEEGGFDVELKTGVGSAVNRQALLNDQIDMYFEYTGTAYTVFHKQDDREIMTDKEKCYEWVKKHDAKKGLVWLKPIRFNNTYTLMMREKQADQMAIKSISDLADYMNEHKGDLVMGVDAEFWARPDGIKPLMKLYNFRVSYSKIRKMDPGLVYKALKDQNVDVSMGFATDGRIDAFNFINLKDDKHFFPTYNPAPVVREEVINKYPEIKKLLNPLAKNLTTKDMQGLNAAVDVEHKSETKVAKEYLKKEGLL